MCINEVNVQSTTLLTAKALQSAIPGSRLNAPVLVHIVTVSR